ncbi:MAG: excisionase family DNA binding protein [Ilumatobacter sp.]|jgi:excisionase family DNA binding protein
MPLLSVADAAVELGVSARRVRQLLASGEMDGQQLGRSWVIDGAAINRLRPKRVGRPWSAASAWAVLELAAGRDPELAPVERSRARKRLADNGLDGLVDQLRSRSARGEMYAHPSALDRVCDERGVVRSGVSALNAYDVDLIASDEAEVYVCSSKVAGLIDRYALDPHADRPNLIIRVVDDDVWPFDAGANVAPWSVVAVDLLDANDERSRRAGLELIERNQ